MQIIDREFQRAWLQKSSKRIREAKTRVDVYDVDADVVQRIPATEFTELLNKLWERRPRNKDRIFLVGMTTKYAGTDRVDASVCNITIGQYNRLRSMLR